MKETSPQEPNLYDLHREYQENRKNLAEAKSDNWPEGIVTGLTNEDERLREEAKKIVVEIPEGKTKAGKDKTGAVELIRRFEEDKKKAGTNNETLLEQAAKEIGPNFTRIAELKENLSDLRDLEMQQFRKPLSADRYKQQAQESLLRTIVNERAGLESRLKELEREDPLASRVVELIKYKQGLLAEGHIAPTPTVLANLGKIGDRMIIGKPMFLHGPTGTGKTSLARFAAKHFTGQAAEMVYCNPQTRESSIWGKTGIRPTENGAIQTIDIYGPLAKAATEGKTVIFDEFTALPREQQVFIKGIFNAKPGDEINIVGNGKTKIAPGFQMIFTANLKSEKNPERQELPPEIAREFEQNNLEIDYTPKEEAYDIMLARLMNSDGSLDLSWYDLNITLPKLGEALEEVQIAYTDKIGEDTAKLTGTLGPSGKSQGLKKYVLTQGTIEAILESWMIEKRRGGQTSFVEFLDDRLKTSLTFKEYPEADRILAAKILASKGFLRTLTPEELSLPRNVFDFDVLKKMREQPGGTKELLTESGKMSHLSIKEIAGLDPFKVRSRQNQERAGQFLDVEYKAEPFGRGKERINPGQLIKRANGEIYVYVGISKQDGSPVLKPYERQISSSLDLVQLEELYNPFLQGTFKSWNQNIPDSQIHGVLESPIGRDYSILEKDTNVAKAGEYTLNPETQGLDFEKTRVFIPDLSAFNGKKLSEVAEHLIKTYGDQYYIPGLEYEQWIFGHQDLDSLPLGKEFEQLKSDLKDNVVFLFGSTLRASDGDWCVPYVYWNGSRWHRDARWLSHTWSSGCRVVLLER